jgi:hypothetical protein
MNMQPPNDINRLMGLFLDLQEQWEDQPEHFNWEALRKLAVEGAEAYNEGLGPSFQILAIDGMQHGEFHARFLDYALDAGFNPFKLVHAGSGRGVVAVFGHEALAEAAAHNGWSAKMHARLQSLARIRFDAELEDAAHSKEDWERSIAMFGDSIPADLLGKLSVAAAKAAPIGNGGKTAGTIA